MNNCNLFNYLVGLPRFSSKILAILFAIPLGASAMAATYYVSPSGNDGNAGNTSSKPFQHLQSALNNANSGDIVYLEAGTYAGPGDADLMVNKAVTFASVSGVASTIINCGGSSQANHFAMTFTTSGTNLTILGSASQPCQIEGITFEGGYESNGGALTISASIVNISNCVFTKNYGDSGGAITADSNSSVNLTNSTFNANNAYSAAGCYDNSGTLFAQGCSFSNNTLYNLGGVLRNTGSATLTSCSLTSNTEGDGGAVYNFGGGASLKLQTCLISGNKATGGTSGIENDNGIVSVEACQLTNNQASGNGGAVYTFNSVSNFSLESCLLANNSASEGGAIYVAGALKVIGCTFSGNKATNTSGGAVYVDTSGSAAFTDDILYGDSATNTSYDEVQNLGQFSITHSDIMYGYSGGNLSSNPLFLSTTNYHIQATSPCLYTGTPLTGLTTDIAGRYRHNPPSMGAYEGGSLWTPVATVICPNENKRVLWASLSGEAALWTITPTGGQSALAFGPFAGYTPVALAVGPDNDAYLAWVLASGEIVVWNVAANGTHTAETFNPGAGWSLVSLSVGPDSYLHISWQDKPGHLWIWNVSTKGAIQYQEYGPE